MKLKTRTRMLLLFVPGALAAILAGAYLLGLLPSFFLAAINILCIPLIAIELAYSCIERANTSKVCGFIASATIGGSIFALNVQTDTLEGGVFRHLSLWSWLWCGLFILSILALSVVLVRLIRWDQTQWEEIHKLIQLNRKERLDGIWTRWKDKRSYRRALLAQKAAAKMEEQIDQADKGRVIRNKVHEQQIKQIEKNPGDLGAQVVKTKKFRVVPALTVLWLILVVALFLFIPVSDCLLDMATRWVTAMEKLARKINFFSLFKLQPQDGFPAAFASYIMTYLILIIAIYCIIWLCKYVYRITVHGHGAEIQDKETEPFLEKYDTPIAVLVVFSAALFSIGADSVPLFGVPNSGAALFSIILFILLAFASVEIVRLVIEQIGQEQSLLKQSIQLIFTALLEFFLGLLLSIIANFRIERVISSLLMLMFPEEEIGFTIKVQEKLQDIFTQEIKKKPGAGEVPFNFRTKQIWRRSHRR